jgi:hypothetical protein
LIGLVHTARSHGPPEDLPGLSAERRSSLWAIVVYLADAQRHRRSSKLDLRGVKQEMITIGEWSHLPYTGSTTWNVMSRSCKRDMQIDIVLYFREYRHDVTGSHEVRVFLFCS